ncbi:hypothetical protein BDV3_002691 [Batrachochytrium dendrobatidis]
MTVSPLTILDRLISENLHGPTIPFNPNSSAAAKANSLNFDQWVLIGDEYTDLDAKDPRWFELFMDFFIKTTGFEVHDDLLFFVRQLPSNSKNSPTALPDSDAVLVKRRTAGVIPALDDVVDWKQSFFLNLISQLPCTLTVAVCTRGSSQAVSTPDISREITDLSLRALDTKPTTNLDKHTLPGGSIPTESNTESSADSGSVLNQSQHAADKTPSASIHDASNGSSRSSTALPNNGIHTPHSSAAPSESTSASNAAVSQPSETSNTRTGNKSRMVAQRRITKKVFASPYKSRMDVKDAVMNECSFPLVYYTVNDFESHALHLPISEREYLCVELSFTIPDNQSSSAYAAATDKVASISLEEDSTPFPVPPNHTKVILFQGAVPYSSLLDNYQQKGLAVQSQFRQAWTNMNRHSSAASTNPNTGEVDLNRSAGRTEYIMMRGPNGKGQCQVAITDNDSYVSADVVSQESSAVENSPPSFTDRLRFFGSVVKNQLIGNTGSLGDHHAHRLLKKPESLRCSMTYVNVPWQSISSDLLEFAKQKKPTATK